jgi:hypothetical protein
VASCPAYGPCPRSQTRSMSAPPHCRTGRSRSRSAKPSRSNSLILLERAHTAAPRRAAVFSHWPLFGNAWRSTSVDWVERLRSSPDRNPTEQGSGLPPRPRSSPWPAWFKQSGRPNGRPFCRRAARAAVASEAAKPLQRRMGSAPSAEPRSVVTSARCAAYEDHTQRTEKPENVGLHRFCLVGRFPSLSPVPHKPISAAFRVPGERAMDRLGERLAVQLDRQIRLAGTAGFPPCRA